MTRAIWRRACPRVLASVLLWLNATGVAMAQTDIAADIQQLAEYSQEAKLAGLRLVDAGVAILPQAHAVLIDGNQPPKLLLQLATIVGEIGDPSSIGPLTTAARNHPENAYINHNALLGLARMSPTAEAIEFAEEVLTSDRPYHSKRTALYFFAAHKLPTGAVWASRTLADSNAAELKDAALYLQARLGDASAKDEIVSMLQEKPRNGIEYNLLRALGELVSVKEFVAATEQLNHASRTYQSALRLVRYNAGSAVERRAVAEEMLKSRYASEQREAIRFLLRSGDTQRLQPFFRPGRAGQTHLMSRVIKGVASREGLTLERRGETIEFRRQGVN